MAGRRTRPFTGGGQYPFWIGLLSFVVLFNVLDPGSDSVSVEPDAALAPPSSAPTAPSAAPPLEGLTLSWRTEGPRDLPTPPDLLACLAARAGRTPTLSPVRLGESFAMEVAWLGPSVRQRLAPAGADEKPGLLAVTAVSGRPHAALSAHLTLAACLRPGSTALVDVELGRRYTAETWPEPQADGSLNVESLFMLEARDGLLMTRGMSRLGLGELALRPAPGQSTEAARVRLQRALAAGIVAEHVGRSLVMDGKPTALTPIAVPGISETWLVPNGGAAAGTLKVRVPAGARPESPVSVPLPGPENSRPLPAARPTSAPLDLDYR